MTAAPLLRGLVARSLTRAASAAQRSVEASMVSTVTILRNGRPVFDSVSGRATTALGTAIYTGPANLTLDAASSEVVIGETPTRMGSLSATIPIGAPMPQVDDVLLVVTGADPQILLAGNGFRIVSVSRGGMIPVARRLALETLEPSAGRSLGVDGLP